MNPSDIISMAYDEYADAIFRHCAYRLMNRERGKELMQETFMKAFQYVKKGQDVENMRALLYRIANNLVIDDVRKKKEVSLEALNEAGFDPTGADDTSVKRKLEEERIFRTLTKLKPEDRELIVLRYIDDFKPQEIADKLKLSPNVVSVRLHRAMKELKDVLKQP